MKKKKVLTTAIVTTLALAGGIVFATSNTNISSSILSADSEEPYSFTLAKDINPFVYDSELCDIRADVDLGGGYLRRIWASEESSGDYLITADYQDTCYLYSYYYFEEELAGIEDNNQILGLQKIEVTYTLIYDGVGSSCASMDIEESDETGDNYEYYTTDLDEPGTYTISHNFVEPEKYHYFKIYIDACEATAINVSSVTVTYTCA